MKTKMKSKRGKAIIGIAMAAIMVASVMMAMVPTATAVAPVVMVDKNWQACTDTTVTYTFTVKNVGTTTDTFTVTYSVPTVGWTYSAPPTPPPITLAAGASAQFTLTVTPPAPHVPEATDICTVTVTDSGTGITTQWVMTYVVNGRYNVIARYAAVTSGAQAVQIGQHLDFATNGFTAPAMIRGDPGSDAVQGEMFQADATNHFDASVMKKTGTYYVTYVAGPPAAWDAQLGVSSPAMTIDLKVDGDSVSTITQNTALQVDFANTLDVADLVSLVITDPDGNVIKLDGTQLFDKISVGYLMALYGTTATAPGIDTTDWKLGTYTFEVKTKHLNARGLEMTSNEKTLTIGKRAITISAETTEVAEDETVRLTVTGVTDDWVRISSSEPAHTEFPGGMDNNPAQSTSGPFEDQIDSDGKRTYAVEFDDTGSYTIKVQVLTGAGGTPTEEEDTVDITVEEKTVMFDLPTTVMLGEKLEVKGTSNTGDWVAIAFDDMVPTGYDHLTIDADKEFSKDITTGIGSPSNKLKSPGSVRLKAFVNLDLTGVTTWPVDVTKLDPVPTDDGSTAILLATGKLTAEISTKSVATGDDFTVSGTAEGPRQVEILTVTPKGPSGKGLRAAISIGYMAGWPPLEAITTSYPGCTYDRVSVSESDKTYSKKLDVRDTANTGTYLVAVLNRGIDGEYDDNAGDTLPKALSYKYGDLSTKTQAQVVSILKDMTTAAGSDDLMWLGYIKVATPFVTLDPTKDVAVGDPLVATGKSNRQEGFTIVVSCTGPVELDPATVKIENGTFTATFDTSKAKEGTYTVKADDGDGHTDDVTVEILTAVPTATPTATAAPTAKPTAEPVPTVAPTATPEPTPTPKEPGFEAVFAIAGMLAIAYLVLRKRRE